MPSSTEKKYRRAVAEFEAFRKSPLVATITPKEADDWKLHMLNKAEHSNRTVKQRLENVRTTVGWGMRQSFGELFPSGNPFSRIGLPGYRAVPSDQRTFTKQEARQVLQAARSETKPDLRWLPWMCAYSGARINEVAQLTNSDFFQVGDDWFYRLTTMGGKTLKTKASERRVPVHPDLIDEGLLDYVAECGDRPDAPLFSCRSQGNVRDWVRNKVCIARPELRPNHGWRHLFEDVAMVAGMLDSAREYISGRASGKSSASYGKSEASLPGLAREMRKIEPFL